MNHIYNYKLENMLNSSEMLGISPTTYLSITMLYENKTQSEALLALLEEKNKTFMGFFNAVLGNGELLGLILPSEKVNMEMPNLLTYINSENDIPTLTWNKFGKGTPYKKNNFIYITDKIDEEFKFLYVKLQNNIDSECVNNKIHNKEIIRLRHNITKYGDFLEYHINEINLLNNEMKRKKEKVRENAKKQKLEDNFKKSEPQISKKILTPAQRQAEEIKKLSELYDMAVEGNIPSPFKRPFYTMDPSRVYKNY